MFEGPLGDQDNKKKSGSLGTWIGPQGRKIYQTFQFVGNQQHNPNTVLNKFENYVRPTKNKRLSRQKLKHRKQLSGESFDNFVKDLKLIIMDCNYTHSEDILVDCIIDGVSDMSK